MFSLDLYGNCDGDILKKICPSSIHKNECDFLPVKNEIISELKYLKKAFIFININDRIKIKS